MPRPERPLLPDGDPLAVFASELRLLRERAGSPKYLQMARRTGRSRTALAEAAGGDHLPTWDTVSAYVKACGGDTAEWLTRWETAKDAATSVRKKVAIADEHIDGRRAAQAGSVVGEKDPPRGLEVSPGSDLAVLLQLWQEQRNQARQCENHRSALGAAVIVAVAAVTVGAELAPSRWGAGLAAAIIVVLGALGGLASHKYYERHQMHMAEAEALRNQIDQLRPVLNIRAGWLGARQTHAGRYPVLYRIRLHQLWIFAHILVAGGALVLVAVAAIR